MGLSSEALEDHCRQILNDRRIKNKIVVLCEGEIRDTKGRRSPQAYKQMEQMPDANFYKKCVPKSWIDKLRPQFFNCGDRQDVINTYFHLLELGDRTISYLNKTKLFALIDLDIQLQKIDNYLFDDTEKIFNNLYKNTKIIPEQADKHRIWITGLIHKEAYFIVPDLQNVFNYSLLCPQYNNAPLSLKDIYLQICSEIVQDMDFKHNYDRVINRINYYKYLDCCDVYKLQKTWNKEFIKNTDTQKKEN